MSTVVPTDLPPAIDPAGPPAVSPSAAPGATADRPAAYRPAAYRHFHRIAWLAVALATCVIVFGAFVRLSNAGLSCPDWPTCYGRAAWPQSVVEADAHGASAIRPFETHKAWREQLHRILAGALGVFVLVLALLAARRHRHGMWQVAGAALLVAVAIPLYMRGYHVAASALAALGELVLLAAALRWRSGDAATEMAQQAGRAPSPALSSVAVLTLAVIICQALLGMWTVTWLLKPVVVMAHLLGGLLTFSLLVWMAWRATNRPIVLAGANAMRMLVMGALLLLGVQVALGGWVSANYAALACGNDFPTCVGRWLPPHDFREGFVLWRGIGVDYEGGVLDGASRIAIQLAHRMMAVLVFVALLGLAIQWLRTPGLRGWATLLGLATIVQVALGIANVKLSLPLPVAVAHNAGAVLLLFVLVSLLARLRAPG